MGTIVGRFPLDGSRELPDWMKKLIEYTVPLRRFAQSEAAPVVFFIIIALAGALYFYTSHLLGLNSGARFFSAQVSHIYNMSLIHGGKGIDTKSVSDVRLALQIAVVFIGFVLWVSGMQIRPVRTIALAMLATAAGVAVYHLSRVDAFLTAYFNAFETYKGLADKASQDMAFDPKLLFSMWDSGLFLFLSALTAIAAAVVLVIQFAGFPSLPNLRIPQRSATHKVARQTAPPAPPRPLTEEEMEQANAAGRKLIKELQKTRGGNQDEQPVNKFNSYSGNEADYENDVPDDEDEQEKEVAWNPFGGATSTQNTESGIPKYPGN